MEYEIRFMVNEHGYKKIIEADNEIMAKQKLLASINIVKCEPVQSKLHNDLFKDMGLEDIFGAFNKK